MFGRTKKLILELEKERVKVWDLQGELNTHKGHLKRCEKKLQDSRDRYDKLFAISTDAMSRQFDTSEIALDMMKEL